MLKYPRVLLLMPTGLHPVTIPISIASAAVLSLWLCHYSGIDYWLASHIATANGFHWKSEPTAKLAHELVRLLSFAVPLILVIELFRRTNAALRRSHAKLCLSALLATTVLIALIKHFSPAYCPWDLARYGGFAPLQAPWAFAVEHYGKCFPSGNAGGAFAGLIALSFVYRHQPQRFRSMLVWVLSLGIISSITQLLRGAHFFSHVLTSFWICALAAALVECAIRWREGHQVVEARILEAGQLDR